MQWCRVCAGLQPVLYEELNQNEAAVNYGEMLHVKYWLLWELHSMAPESQKRKEKSVLEGRKIFPSEKKTHFLLSGLKNLWYLSLSYVRPPGINIALTVLVNDQISNIPKNDSEIKFFKF